MSVDGERLAVAPPVLSSSLLLSIVRVGSKLATTRRASRAFIANSQLSLRLQECANTSKTPKRPFARRCVLAFVCVWCFCGCFGGASRVFLTAAIACSVAKSGSIVQRVTPKRQTTS